MIEGRIKNLMIVCATVGTLMSVVAVVQAAGETDTEPSGESVETVFESVETSVCETTSETSELLSTETVVTEPSVTTISEETENSLETEASSETSETEETEESEQTEFISHDFSSCFIYGWYVPSFDYNGNGTITYYLEDDTPFYSIEMNDLDLPDYAWAYTGLRGYIDYCYGSINGLSGAQMESFETAEDMILSGEVA